MALDVLLKQFPAHVPNVVLRTEDREAVGSALICNRVQVLEHNLFLVAVDLRGRSARFRVNFTQKRQDNKN